ncbi:MAG: energy transducer TonB [Bacteroidales bacterium]|nr:energy transducer TonB [Bacteroidales bacterium]MBD5229590.1 energy transducer TonB [Bacteroidales bacterium]MBD5235855.1 energy transducer TonB [Barnesiella sp.]MBD5247976.1 energy transducer TonB [Barnesiella sp.]MBD5257426.1 energy transducer TonB [Barnesiella sp.]
MAKDVDLSSKEWTDIIFEGKNKEFGAYTLRQGSDRRHNLAVLYVVAGLVVVLILAWLYGMYQAEKEREEKERIAELLAQVEQQQFEEFEAELEIPEEEENQMEQDQDIPEPEEEEALAEEILNTEKFTEFLVQKDEEVTEQVKSADEVKDTSTALGSTNFDQGTDDLNIVREHKNEVIVEEKKPVPVEENKVFTSVEQMPQFPGGEAELLKYISSHIKYPAIAMENNVQGRVVVQFVVTKDGSIGEVKVARGKDPDLDKEAVRVVKTLPKFIPGKMNGQAVNVWYTLPINFKLQGV